MDFWFVTAMVLLLGALEYAMPQLTRHDIFFSVTVPPEFRSSPEGAAILAGYRRGIVAVTTVVLFLALLNARYGSDFFAAGLLMLEAVASVACFLPAHRRALAYSIASTTVREASLEATPPMPGVALLLIGPAVMIVCAIVMAMTHWDRIPDPIPVHWDLLGNPNGWLPKTSLAVFGFIASMAGTCLIMTFALLAMLYAPRRINWTGIGAREESRFRWIGIALLFAADYLVASTSFLPLSPHSSLILGSTAFLTVITIVGSLELVRRGQAGARLAPVHHDRISGDLTPDQCWKWGMIYYNPEDPALIVEKRFGIGWTLNFGHRGAWIFMGLIALVIALSIGMPLVGAHK